MHESTTDPAPLPGPLRLASIAALVALLAVIGVLGPLLRIPATLFGALGALVGLAGLALLLYGVRCFAGSVSRQAAEGDEGPELAGAAWLMSAGCLGAALFIGGIGFGLWRLADAL